MDSHILEIIPMKPNQTSNINITIPNALRKMGINPNAYEKYLEKKYGHTSFNFC